MKTWTNPLTLAALAATLTLAACTEDGPGSVAAVPDPDPGDPAIYAPDGWPLQIGDKVSFYVVVTGSGGRNGEPATHQPKPVLPYPGLGEILTQFRLPISAERSPWVFPTFGAHVVGNRVYAPRFVPLADGESEWPDVWVYRGHFRMRFEPWMRPLEWHLPPEFHGKVEYQSPQNPRRWPDYPERRK